MTQTVPAEYLGYDFGFTAVDETEFASKTASPPEPQPPALPGEVLEKILDRLESKIDAIGIRVDEMTATDATQDTVEDYGAKIRRLEAIIVPLLNNLLKTADKDFIHWPNRRPMLQKQLDLVLSITRGELGES